jgi:hypothetical protein
MSIARPNVGSSRGAGFVVVLWAASAAISCQFPDVSFEPGDASTEGGGTLGDNGLGGFASEGGPAASSAGAGESSGGSASSGVLGSASTGSSGAGIGGNSSGPAAGSTGGSSGSGGSTGSSGSPTGTSGGGSTSSASGSTSSGSASGSTSGGSTSGSTSGGSGSGSASGSSGSGSGSSSGSSSGGANCACTGSQTLYPTGVNCGSITIVGAGLLCTQTAGFTDSNVPCGQTNNTFVQCATAGLLSSLVCIASTPTTMTQQCH